MIAMNAMNDIFAQAYGCKTAGAIGKHEIITLPRVSVTDANVVGISLGDSPPFRHGQRLRAIVNHRAIINSARMQRHVEVAAGALENAGYRV